MMKHKKKFPLLFAILIGAIASIVAFQLSFAAGALNCTEIFSGLSSLGSRVEVEQDRCNWYGAQAYTLGLLGKIDTVKESNYIQFDSLWVDKQGNIENARFIVQREADTFKTPPKISLTSGEIGENYIGGYDDNFNFSFLPDQADVHLVINTNPIGGGQKGVTGSFVESFRVGTCVISMSGDWNFDSREREVVSGVPLLISKQIGDTFSQSLFSKLHAACPSGNPSPVTISENAMIVMKPKPTLIQASDSSKPQDVLSSPQQPAKVSLAPPTENTPEVQKPIMVGGNGNFERIFPLPVVDSRGVVVIQGIDVSSTSNDASDLEFALSGGRHVTVARKDIIRDDLPLDAAASTSVSALKNVDQTLLDAAHLTVHPIETHLVVGRTPIPVIHFVLDENETRFVEPEPSHWEAKWIEEKDAIGRQAMLWGKDQTKLLSELNGAPLQLPIAITNEGNMTIMKFEDTAGAISPETQLQVSEKNSISLEQGSVAVSHPTDPYGTRFTIHTPFGDVTSDHTRFWVAHNPDMGYTLVGIWEGRVAIVASSGETMTLEPNANGQPNIALLLPVQSEQAREKSSIFWVIGVIVLLIIGGSALILRKKGKF